MESSFSQWRPSTVNAKSEAIHVHVERHVWHKMFGWCRAASSEVSGVGLAKIEDGRFIVYDVFFPKQYCSSGYTELDDEALGRLNFQLFKRKRKPEDVKFWWHTHYNFGTFWSGTDDDNAQRLAKGNGEWEISIVINQKGDWLARADFIKPVKVTFDQLPIFLIPDSRKHKKKRNFKADIRKWVRPLSENPNKPLVVPPSYNYVPDWFNRFKELLPRVKEQPKDDDTAFWGGYQDESWRGHNHHIKPSIPYLGDKKTGSEDWTKKNPTFGKNFILHEGRFITRKKYKELTKRDCFCSVRWQDGVCWECREKQREGGLSAPPFVLPDKEPVALEPGTPAIDLVCPCLGQDFTCEACYPSGAVEIPVDGKKCFCAHTGNWEDCTCVTECNKCFEVLAREYQ